MQNISRWPRWRWRLSNHWGEPRWIQNLNLLSESTTKIPWVLIQWFFWKSINIYICVCWSDVPIYIYINQWIWCSNGFPIEINQKNPMAFTMGFHNDLPMMFGLTMAFTMDFPMMFQWKITQNHGFYHGLNMMEILRLSAFCQCSSAPQKARKPKPKDGPKMWCLKLRIPKMTVFLLGKMMIIRSPPIFGLP